MSMHPDYPDVVKSFLASDLYWSHDPESITLVPEENFAERRTRLWNELRLRTDTEAAHHIGSIVTSLEAGGTVGVLPLDSRLPTPNNRQVLRVVEDSRKILSKLSVERMATGAVRAHILKKYRKIDPNYQPSTFEENLAAIYASRLSLGTEAETAVSYSITQLAVIRRCVLYMRRDEESGLFTALKAGGAAKPQVWNHPYLELIPDVRIGQVYPKNPMQRSHLGRIISAEVIEPTSILWKQDKKPPRRNGDKKREALLSGSSTKLLHPSS